MLFHVRMDFIFSGNRTRDNQTARVLIAEYVNHGVDKHRQSDEVVIYIMYRCYNVRYSYAI